jgi:hypothetical protein
MTANIYETMSLLDYFSRYHQIWLRKEDEEKRSFITPFGTYCYLRMPEGLKNASSTFYRMAKAILNEQMEGNIFTYVGNIVVASRKKGTQLQDLVETFTNMWRAQLKLNHEKCMFGVHRGKVLGYLVSVRAIEANPNKINAIVHMKLPRSRKEVQRLTGRIASLNRFMAKLVERSLPFFKVLKGSGSFEWGQEQQQAFDALKEYIQKLSMLASPQSDQPLILHVSATHTTVSVAHVQERETSREGRKLSHQVPIYFISEALAVSNEYNSEMEKICYAIVMSARKLRHYFKAHRIRVLTNQPLNDIFGNRDSSGRIGKWAVELSEHVIDFEKWSATKSQVQEDFIVDWIEPSSYTECTVIDTPLQVYGDGAWGVFGAGVAAILKSPSGTRMWYATWLQFMIEADKCSINIVEYEAVLLDLRKLWAMGV